MQDNSSDRYRVTQFRGAWVVYCSERYPYGNIAGEWFHWVACKGTRRGAEKQASAYNRHWERLSSTVAVGAW